MAEALHLSYNEPIKIKSGAHSLRLRGTMTEGKWRKRKCLYYR